MSGNEYSVYQFFKDDQYERVREFVSAEEAVKAFFHYTRSVAAQVGIVVRVIVTDGWDFTTLEWQFDRGITFPPELIKGDLKI